jgi:Tol biopolymer transport system component
MATAVPTPTVTQDLTFVIDQYLAEDFLDLSRSDYDYLRVVSASGVDHSKFDEDYYGIFVEDVEAGLRELISELSWKRDPKISPDGQKVAYIWWYDIEDDWNSNILITNIEDKETITIFGRGSAIEWSPDGRLLAVCDSYEDITIINLETEAKRSFDIRVSCEYFSWSPTGNKFVWLTRAGDHVNDDDGWMPLIYDIQTDHFLYIGDVEDNFGVYGPILWTKDGKHIIFESFELNTAGDRSNFQLMIADADGVQQEVLTQNVQVVDQRRFPWTKWVSPGEDIYFPH